MNFGEKINYLMIKHNLKYAKDIAYPIGLTADTINQYKKKETPEGIEIMKIKKLADFFDVSVDYFLENDEITNTIINEYKYINIDDVKDFDINRFITEVKNILLSADIKINGKEVNEQKKYIIDSLDIGYKLLKHNI